MNDEYILEAKNAIEKWESEGPGFLSKVGNIVSWPAQRAVNAFIPEGLQEAIGKAIFKFLSGLGSATPLIINEGEIRNKVKALREEHGFGLRAMDEAAKHYWRYHVGYAAAEGAATGAVGLPGIAADIPALFTIAVRQIQQIGICYGYDVKRDMEQEYVMHILRTGSTGDVAAKTQFMVGLKQVEEILRRVSLKKMNDALALKELGQYSLLTGIRQFAKSLGVNITRRKALQIVPIVSALIGGAFNSIFVYDIGEAAFMSYRRRRLEEDEGMDAASLML